MRFANHEWIDATPRQTWNALHDPAVLQRCLRDCRSVTRRSDTEFQVLFDTSSADAAGQFEGTILLESAEAPHRLRIVFDGSGPHAGLAIGHAEIDLAAASHGGTRLGYQLEAAAGGALARVGHDELQRCAHRHLEGFFLRLNSLARDQPGAEPPPPPPADTGKRSWSSWLPVLVVLAVVLGYFIFLRP